MFEKFADYMFYLLNAPLKKHKDRNQLFIFFKAAGREFDQIKNDIMRLRLETLITTASPAMLEVHGHERDMARVKGESIEGYRKRLLMKAVIAELAGSEKGILLAVKSVGYENCRIEPLWKTDRTRWAEFYIDFRMQDLDEENSIDFECIRREVQKVKQASTYPNYRFFYPTVIQENEEFESRIRNRSEISFWDGTLLLNGGFLQDGKNNLDASMVALNTRSIFRDAIENTESLSVAITIEKDLWVLDGAATQDGSRKMDAYILKEAV